MNSFKRIFVISNCYLREEVQGLQLKIVSSEESVLQQKTLINFDKHCKRSFLFTLKWNFSS